MGTSIKAVCYLGLGTAVIMSLIGWAIERPDAGTWVLRLVFLGVGMCSIGTLVAMRFRRDVVPDYLRDMVRDYFNRDGFCFSVHVMSENGVAYMVAHFQNQYDKPCLGQIALRPARGFFLGRAEIDVIGFQIECAPAAFGVARIPFPIPEKLQGKRQSFEVGASVEYPNGKGKRLRFHDGIFIRSNSKFGSTFRTALTIAGAAGGAIVLMGREMVKLDLPVGVIEVIQHQVEPEVETRWRMGEPPLKKV